MMPQRREFLKSLAGTGLAGWWGDLGALGSFSAAVAGEAGLTPDLVQLDAEIEPLVRLIEETPRDKCFDMLVAQLRRGMPYRRILAGLFLAGIRNVNPQPPGFKFHCVFVIHAAHQLSLDAAAGDRLLPLFWALDNFKVSQQQDIEQGDFRLRPVRGTLPAPERAWAEFREAMDAWDEERADRAVVALVRSRGANEIIEGFWRYGARDFRNIGHKAIFVANTWRTLQTIGWRHAEPALRSLVLGLLDFGRGERVNEYAYEDQSYLANAEAARQAAGQLPGNWASRTGDPAVTRELLEIFRAAPVSESCQTVLTRLREGRATASSVWDAVHLQSGELMMRQPGIYGIHTVTSVNGLRYAYEAAADPETRLVLLLQGVGWMGQFQRFMASKNDGLKNRLITEIAPVDIPQDPAQAAEEILALVATDTPAAAARALAFAQRHPEAEEFSRAALRLIFRKGTDAHDYKYPAAVFEDYRLVSPTWRPQMLATAVYHLPGSTSPDAPLMARAIVAAEGV
jgi:hypothetical protein